MTHNNDSAATGCACLQRFCCGWDAQDTESYILQDDSATLQRVSKWRNLIRNVGRICNPRRYEKSSAQFRYSPESYALNFSDDGTEEDDSLLHSFSTRYAPGFSVADQHNKGAT